LKLYLDTSVLVAYYCPEPLSRRVQELLVESVKPAMSCLTEVELYSAVARKVRWEEISGVDGNRILAKFSSHMDMNLFTILPIDDHHWRLARSWIGLFSTPLRTLDALHLAVASAGEFVLITANKSLRRSADILGVEARLIDGEEMQG
jgi:predicted nucleic acid-binding protein